MMLQSSLNSSDVDLKAPLGCSLSRNLFTSARSCNFPRMYPRIESWSKLLFFTPADKPRKRLNVMMDQSTCSSSIFSPYCVRIDIPSRQYFIDPLMTSASGEFCGQQPGVMNWNFLWSPFDYRLRISMSLNAARNEWTCFM